ncbi:MAG: hypothetical protein M3N29_09145 [Chloroflexota bacterium]|nr:hypothetical protein [Chloroflexota bacterium]
MEIVAESGVGAIPFLIPILNLCLLQRGVLPLHASAFVHGGIGTVAMGWSQSGKTEVLLAALGDGGTYVSDEWSYVSGGIAYGLPTRVRVEAGHRRAEAVVRSPVSWPLQRRLAALALLDGIVAQVRLVGRSPLPGRRLTDRLLAAARRRTHVDVPPRQLFGARACVPSLALQRALWLVPTDGEGVHVERVPARDVAARMVFAHVHHRMSLLDVYWRHRYAHPELASTTIEQMAVLEADLLQRFLAHVPTFLVEHPRHASPLALLPALKTARIGRTRRGSDD